MKTAEDIVRALASRARPETQGGHGDGRICALCGGMYPGGPCRPECAHRMAVEWVKDWSNDPLREQLRRRGLWINSAGKLVELCAYHDTNPAHDHRGIENCGPSCAWSGGLEVADWKDERPR
jgi:hypothetical protein